MNWDWGVFCRSTLSGEPGACFGAADELSYLQWMISAWAWTVSVATLAFLLALVLGILIGTLRTVSYRSVAGLATAWTELFRNIPLLVQVFLWYHLLPMLLPAFAGMPTFLLASLALGLFTSARIAEQVRSGLQSLPAGQAQAARTLGLSQFETYTLVLMPQSLRVIVPALTSEAMNVVKNSSVAFAVSLTELSLFAMQAQEETGRGMEIYAGVTLLYVLTAFAVNRMMVYVEQRSQLQGRLQRYPDAS